MCASICSASLKMKTLNLCANKHYYSLITISRSTRKALWRLGGLDARPCCNMEPWNMDAAEAQRQRLKTRLMEHVGASRRH